VELEAADGHRVRVTARGLFSADPMLLRWGSRQWRLTGWAGPWPLDEHWWTPESAASAARAQVQLDSSDTEVRVLLLVYLDEIWRAEGLYD